MRLKCCVACFADEDLRSIVRSASKRKGTCDYCRRARVTVIDVGALYQPFKNMMSLYVPSEDEHGDFLIDLIQGDCEVFGERLYESGEADRLLEDVLASGWDDDDGEPRVAARDLYISRSSERFHTTMAEAWEEFCEKVKAEPRHEPDFPQLFDEDLCRLEVDLPRGTLLHRARVGFVDEPARAPRPYAGMDIGPPPLDKARPGRANGQGEVVLYVADQEATAVAEVRPSRGLLVSVAEVKVGRDLRIIELSRWVQVSFPLSDEAPHYWAEMQELLFAFGEELAQPLRRADDPADYLPCQKLVRRIRRSGFFDGIRYSSAMAQGGSNVVLFDPGAVQIGRSKIVEVRNIVIAYGSTEEE